MQKINAKTLVTYKRLDLIVKYLYAKELLEQENNYYSTKCYEDLYIRHILMRTMGQEPDGTKQTIQNYIENYKNLIQNIKGIGFDETNPIPIDGNYLLANGAHRLSACLALDKEVCIKEIENGLTWDFNWFEQNGFNTEDKQRILKGFVDLKSENCAIFVVWNPLFQYLDNVKTILNKYFDIVGDVELDFEDNYIAFTNALLEIYEPNISKTNCDETILAKSKLLQANHLSFKVIVVTNQNKNSNEPISELSKNCKDDIRDLFNHVLPKETFCTVHSSDGSEECQYLANILLSPNNIKHLKMKFDYDANPEFVQRIRNLPSFLKTLEIPTSNDICVIGSGVMTALGIQKISDSDFIVNEKYRNRLGWNTVYLNNDYDIGVSDKVANRPKNIPDNILIYNSEYHFWFRGMKFANLEIIKDRKLHSKRPKDLIHIRQIDLFEKMIGHYNQRKCLLQRIEEEKCRRLGINQPKQQNTKKNPLNLKNKISKTLLLLKLIQG